MVRDVKSRFINLREIQNGALSLPIAHANLFMTVTDGRTYEIEASTMEEALFRSQ